MPDRLKEAIFAWLGNHYDCPGELPPLSVADVFAGCGSMGLEALSRGAATCYFFERNRQAVESLRRNIEGLGAENQATIIPQNAWQWAVSDPQGKPFDLILLDPPYRDSLDSSTDGQVYRYLQSLAVDDKHRPLVVLHHSATVQFTGKQEDRRWIIDERSFGSSAMTVFSL